MHASFNPIVIIILHLTLVCWWHNLGNLNPHFIRAWCPCCNNFSSWKLYVIKIFLWTGNCRVIQNIHLSQTKYTPQLLLRLPLSMDPNLKLTVTDISTYKHLIGFLIYLTIFRPYIRYDVNRLSQFMSNNIARHLLQY